MKSPVNQVFNVSDSLVNSLYCIVDQVRPGAAIGIQGTLRDDVQCRGHILFLYNGVCGPLGFIKGKILGAPVFQQWCGNIVQSKIDSLFVDKRYHRSGIGGTLLRTYEEYCCANGVGAIVLQRVPTIQAAQFYSRHGYINIGGKYIMGKILNTNKR